MSTLAVETLRVRINDYIDDPTFAHQSALARELARTDLLNVGAASDSRLASTRTLADFLDRSGSLLAGLQDLPVNDDLGGLAQAFCQSITKAVELEIRRTRRTNQTPLRDYVEELGPMETLSVQYCSGLAQVLYDHTDVTPPPRLAAAHVGLALGLLAANSPFGERHNYEAPHPSSRLGATGIAGPLPGTTNAAADDGGVTRRDDGGVTRRDDGGVTRRDDGGVTRRDDGGGFVRVNLPSGLAARFEVLEVLPASGAEADLLLVADAAGVRRVVKLYRSGIEPDRDVKCV